VSHASIYLFQKIREIDFNRDEKTMNEMKLLNLLNGGSEVIINTVFGEIKLAAVFKREYYDGYSPLCYRAILIKPIEAFKVFTNHEEDSATPIHALFSLVERVSKAYIHDLYFNEFK